MVAQDNTIQALPARLSLGSGGNDGRSRGWASCGQGRAHHRRGVGHRPGDGGFVSSRGRQGRRDRPQRSGPESAWGRRGPHARPGRDRRSALARGGRRGPRRLRSPRHSRQQRRNRDPRQYRDDDARRLSQGQRGQRRGRVSRLPRGGAGDEGDGRLDRQPLVGRRNHRRRLVARLLREQRAR